MELVKIFTTEGGDKIEKPVWCLVKIVCGGSTALCSQQYFGQGESGVEWDTKQGKLKDIDCPECISIIKWFKKLK